MVLREATYGTVARVRSAKGHYNDININKYTAQRVVYHYYCYCQYHYYCCYYVRGNSTYVHSCDPRNPRDNSNRNTRRHHCVREKLLLLLLFRRSVRLFCWGFFFFFFKGAENNGCSRLYSAVCMNADYDLKQRISTGGSTPKRFWRYTTVFERKCSLF